MKRRVRQSKKISKLKKHLTDYTRDKSILLAWLCAVRCLPFIEWKGTFDFWPERERQKFLMSILKAVDSIAYSTYDDDSAIADYASIDVFNAIASFEGCDDATIFLAVQTIAEAVTIAADINSYKIKDIATNVAFGFHVSFESILQHDLYSIDAGKNDFLVNTDIYQESWQNFKNALNDLDCSYWVDWYESFFANGFYLDDIAKAEIKQRLNAPHGIIARGAAAMGKYMEENRPQLDNFAGKVFLSYCHADKDLADIIDNFLQKHHSITASRDIRDVDYTKSFKAFMQTIGNHDYVIMLVSDSFLRSKACMYEAGEMISTRSLESKLLFIVVQEDDSKFYKTPPSQPIGANIYDSIKRTEYITFWENRYTHEEESIRLIKSDSAKIEPLKALRDMRKIIDQDISPFFEYLSDARGKSFSEMHEINFADIIANIKQYKTT